MDYKVIDRETSENLKLSIHVKKEQFVNFNLSTAYFLRDSSVVVQPLNPYGKCLHIFDIKTFEEFLNQENFPITEKFESLYLNNLEIVNNIEVNKHELLNSLYRVVYNESNAEIIDIDKIEYIYSTLKKTKKLKTYKLHFIILVADFIIKYDNTFKLGIVKIKQLMNPICRIVIVTDETNGRYFNLEQEIEDKIEIFGIKYIISRASSRLKKSDEFEEIVKIISR